MNDDDYLIHLTALSDSELLDVLAANLLGDDYLGAGSEDRRERRKFAEEWLSSQVDPIRERVCSGQLERNIGTLSDGRAVEAAAILDIAAAKLGLDAAGAATVAAIVATRGYDWLCG